MNSFQDTPSTPDTKQALPNLPGIDLQASLHRAGNNWAVLEKSLSIFLRMNISIETEFSKALKTENWKNVEFISHALKGSAATIGAMTLSSIAGKIESHIKTSQFSQISSMYGEFHRALNDVLTGIQSLQSDKQHNKELHNRSIPSNIGSGIKKLIEETNIFISSDIVQAEVTINQLIAIYESELGQYQLAQEIKIAFENFNLSRVKSLLCEQLSKLE